MELLFQAEERPVSPRRSVLGQYPLDRTQADPTQVARAAALLAKAKAPIVYAGGGVIGSGAQDELRALQELAALPVATSTMGKGSVDETHALSMGCIGYYMATRGMAKFMKPLVTEADVILLVGNRTNQNGTDSWKLLPSGATYIHLDIDPMEIGRNYDSVRLQGDAKLTLRALHDAMATQDRSTREAARPRLEQVIAAAKASHREEVAGVTQSEATPIRPERFMAELDRQLAPDHIVVADASFSSIWVANYVTAKLDRRFITPRGQAGLGWGFPLAMGAKIGQPGRPVFAIVGDGGFGHVWSEMETARRHGVKVVVAVMNNAILGYQKHAETAGLGRYTGVCDFCTVDHAAIARACGVRGIRLDRTQDIAAAIAGSLAADGPVLLDLVADPNAMPPVTAFSGLPNY